jgi:hypothetical protein
MRIATKEKRKSECFYYHGFTCVAVLAIPDFPLANGRLIPAFTTSEIAINFLYHIGAILILIWTMVTAGIVTVLSRTAIPLATSNVLMSALIP